MAVLIRWLSLGWRFSYGLVTYARSKSLWNNQGYYAVSFYLRSKPAVSSTHYLSQVNSKQLLWYHSISSVDFLLLMPRRAGTYGTTLERKRASFAVLNALVSCVRNKIMHLQALLMHFFFFSTIWRLGPPSLFQPLSRNNPAKFHSTLSAGKLLDKTQ